MLKEVGGSSNGCIILKSHVFLGVRQFSEKPKKWKWKMIFLFHFPEEKKMVFSKKTSRTNYFKT